MCTHHDVGGEFREAHHQDALTRRDLIANSARVAAAGGLAAAVVPSTVAQAVARPAAVGAAGRTQIYLLGAEGGQNRAKLTGSDIHAGPSVLLIVDGVGYLMDAGVGALLRLNQAGFDPTIVRHVFMTHHHQDHNADLGNIIGFGWTTGAQTHPGQRLDVWGPPGTLAYTRGYEQATARSIHDQEANLGKTPSFRSYLHCHQFPISGPIRTRPVKVMRDAAVAVSAIRVNHGELPTVGYRFKTPDLDVVFSGDRGDRGDNFIALARGAGLLFHEIVDIDLVIPGLKAQKAPASFIRHQKHDHSGPAVVAQTASAAKVPKLVLYHLIPGNPGITSDTRWTSLISPHYAGEIVVGKDLLEIV